MGIGIKLHPVGREGSIITENEALKNLKQILENYINTTPPKYYPPVENLLDLIYENYKEQYGMEDLDAMHYMRMCNALAANLQTNTEFALLIILLKKMNQSNDYVKKKVIPGELTKIRKEYRENLIFICELQEGCYGSVSEQTETFEKMMPYYMKQEIIDTKLAAIDGMLENEKNRG